MCIKLHKPFSRSETVRSVCRRLSPAFLCLPQKPCNLILAPVHILFQQVYDFFVEAFLVPTLKPLSARLAAAQNCPVLSGFHTHGSTGTTKRCL